MEILWLGYVENISLERRKGVIVVKKSGQKVFCEIQGCANSSEGYLVYEDFHLRHFLWWIESDLCTYIGLNEKIARKNPLTGMFLGVFLFGTTNPEVRLCSPKNPNPYQFTLVYLFVGTTCSSVSFWPGGALTVTAFARISFKYSVFCYYHLLAYRKG